MSKLTLSRRVRCSSILFLLVLSLFQLQGCSRLESLLHGNKVLTPIEVFQKVSPSVFVVETLGQDGKPMMLGSGVVLAKDFILTNCHVVQGGSFIRVVRGKKKWGATLILAVPEHDLCGLTPGSLNSQKWDPVAEFHTRWPEAGSDDETILNNLRDPAKFRAAFPNYDGLSDGDIHDAVEKHRKPTGPDLVPVDVVPSSELATGEHVYSIGAPEGLELTFAEGVISAIRDSEGTHVIQTGQAAEVSLT
jgi:S1-C subfamily serine protease